MKGINFVINEQGEKKAVLIDLDEWGELWEDFSDILISRNREDEAEISWDELKAELEVENKVNV
jgi:PHD/YefM family antitoxin component YafN of YafNO toxin-antitoxin module